APHTFVSVRRRVGRRGRRGRRQPGDRGGEDERSEGCQAAHGAYHARFESGCISGARMTTLAGRMMLQRSPLFRGLAPATFERIAALATQRGYRRDELVFSHGDPGDALYAVVTGRIRISTGNASGR